MADVVLRNIRKRFNDTTVIENFSLEIQNGEFVTLLGPSGCGKTTLLRMIAGLETIDGGDLLISGKRFNSVPPQKRKIAMVFQTYALFPHMNVRENILFGLKIKKSPLSLMQQKLSWVLPLLDLNGLEDRLPKELSGGQRQRIALARALVLDPDVLLLDEPLSNLDAALREMAMEELKRIHRQVGKTIIYVTHNQVEAMTMSERIAIINHGKLEQYDRPKMVYDMPRTVFAGQFIGSPPMNFLEGTIVVNNDTIGVMTAIGFIQLDRSRAGCVESFIGRKVMVGIRPQNISYIEHRASRRVSDSNFELYIELVEVMGDRSLIVGRLGDVILRFLITREAELVPDQKVLVFIDGRRIHLFDPESSISIC